MNNSRLSKEISKLFRSKPACLQDIILPLEGQSSNLYYLTIYIKGPEQTPYYNGFYKILIKFPENYPSSPPTARFQTKIFHPNINFTTGDVCVDLLKKNWSPNRTIDDVLVTIRCLLIEPNPESSLNDEAGKLLLEDYNEFVKTAKLMTKVHSLKKIEGYQELELEENKNNQVTEDNISENFHLDHIQEENTGLQSNSLANNNVLQPLGNDNLNVINSGGSTATTSSVTGDFQKTIRQKKKKTGLKRL